MLLQLNPPLWLETPKGLALAHFLLDSGAEHNMTWGCFINDGPHAGEIWWVENPHVRACKNWTIERYTVNPVGKTAA